MCADASLACPKMLVEHTVNLGDRRWPQEKWRTGSTQGTFMVILFPAVSIFRLPSPRVVRKTATMPGQFITSLTRSTISSTRSFGSRWLGISRLGRRPLPTARLTTHNACGRMAGVCNLTWGVQPYSPGVWPLRSFESDAGPTHGLRDVVLSGLADAPIIRIWVYPVGWVEDLPDPSARGASARRGPPTFDVL